MGCSFQSIDDPFSPSFSFADNRALSRAEHCHLHDEDLAQGNWIRPLVRRAHAENLEVRVRSNKTSWLTYEMHTDSL